MAATENPVLQTALEHWDDIGFACSAEAHSHYVDVKVYCSDFFEDGRRTYQNDEDVCQVPVDTLEEASVYLSGHVKWDGCANLSFDWQERAALHFCSIQQAKNTGVLLGRVYELAAKLMPQHADMLNKT